MGNSLNQLDKFLTEEGLMPANRLFYSKNHLYPSQSHFSIKGIADIKIFPVPEVRGVVEYLLDKSDLWKQAEIRVEENKPEANKRAPIIAVPFYKAVEIVLGHHFEQQGKFYMAELNDPPAYKDIGFTSILFFLVNKLKGEKHKIELQAWECYGKEREVFYIHGEIFKSPNNLIFTHLDGAFIDLDDAQKAELFAGNTDVKGHKEKFFRFGKADGEANLPYEDAVELIRAFFPAEEITDEAFTVKPYPKIMSRRT